MWSLKTLQRMNATAPAFISFLIRFLKSVKSGFTTLLPILNISSNPATLPTWTVDGWLQLYQHAQRHARSVSIMFVSAQRATSQSSMVLGLYWISLSLLKQEIWSNSPVSHTSGGHLKLRNTRRFSIQIKTRLLKSASIAVLLSWQRLQLNSINLKVLKELEVNLGSFLTAIS